MGKLLLPAGLIVALMVAMVFPDPGIWLGESPFAFVMIATIFLINGYQTHPRSLVVTRRLVGGFLIAAAVSFGGGSLLGSTAARLPVFDEQIALGLIVMSIMAPTLSSVIVITKESGGNTAWAALLTMGLNFLAIFLIPPLLEMLLVHTDKGIPEIPLFRDLVLSVVLPFCLGLLLRHWLKRPPIPIVNLTPTLLVILLSYVSFSGGRETVLGSGLSLLGWIVGVSLAIHLGLLGFAVLATSAFGFAPEERKAIAFLSSQKTLPIAVGVLAALGFAGGAALLPCVIFHFCQILVDALIAARWKGRKTCQESVEAGA